MGKELVLRTSDREIGGFTIAGSDRQFYPAQVRKQENKIILSAKELDRPVTVRYGCADNPDLELYNDALLPASPFRTYQWNK